MARDDPIVEDSSDLTTRLRPRDTARARIDEPTVAMIHSVKKQLYEKAAYSLD